MKKVIIVSMLALATGLGFTVTASAQSVSCGDLVWTDTALELNPNIGDHCLEVVERDGQQMAKMRARVVRQSVNSTIVQWQRPDGSWSPSERRYPDRGFRAQIGNDDVRIMDLPDRQEVRVTTVRTDCSATVMIATGSGARLIMPFQIDTICVWISILLQTTTSSTSIVTV